MKFEKILIQTKWFFLYVKCKITRGKGMLRNSSREWGKHVTCRKGSGMILNLWVGTKGTVLSKNLRQNICGSHNKVIFRFKVSLQTYFWEGKERWWGIEEREGMREWIKIWPRTQAIDPRAVVLRQRNSKMIVQDPQNWAVSRLRATGLEPVRHFRKNGQEGEEADIWSTAEVAFFLSVYDELVTGRETGGGGEAALSTEEN